MTGKERMELLDRFAIAVVSGWLSRFPEDIALDEVSEKRVASGAYDFAVALLDARETLMALGYAEDDEEESKS